MKEQCLTPKLAFRLAAPHSWLAAIYPALFGELYCLLSGDVLSLGTGAALLGACVLMQSAVNTLNDYFDFVKGADSADDCVEVSDAVLVYEHIAPKQALALGIGYLAAAVLLALPVILSAGPAPFLVGVIGAAAVLAYSGGAVSISYLPVGELVSGVVMGGLIPLGIVAAVRGTLDAAVMAAALPFIMGIGLIMMTNNICDIEKDRRVRRCTLPVLLGRQTAVRCYRAMVVLWIILLFLVPVVYAGLWGMLTPLLAAVMSRRAFAFLLRSPLVPDNRIRQMKGILQGNLLGNGAYLLMMTGLWIGGILHG